MASIEHDLFEEWMGLLQAKHPEHSFMFDGIVCQEEWDKADKHILLVLKDYNEKKKPITLDKINIENPVGIFNLRKHLRVGIGSDNKNGWKVWDNAARWVYGLSRLTIDDYPSFEKANPQGDSDHRSSNLKKVAVIDVKKKPGTSSCNKAKLIKFFKEYPENILFTARQIALYGQLDYIICCGSGVFDIFKKIVKSDVLKDKYNIVVKTSDYLVTENGTVIVNYIHPLLLGKGMGKKDAYLILMKLVQKILQAKNV